LPTSAGGGAIGVIPLVPVAAAAPRRHHPLPAAPVVPATGVRLGGGRISLQSSVVGNLAPASAPSSPRAVQVGALLVPLQQISASPVSAPPPPSPRALGFAPNPSTARAFGPAHPLEAQSARSNLSSSEASSDGRHVVISSHHTAVEQVGFDTSKTYLLSPTLLLLFCL
jgi:hypothetical protein